MASVPGTVRDLALRCLATLLTGSTEKSIRPLGPMFEKYRKFGFTVS